MPAYLKVKEYIYDSPTFQEICGYKNLVNLFDNQNLSIL